MEYVGTSQAAKELGQSRDTISRLCREDKIPAE